MCGAETINCAVGQPAMRLCDGCKRTELVIAPRQPLGFLCHTFRQNGPCQYRQIVLRDDLKRHLGLLGTMSMPLDMAVCTGFVQQECSPMERPYSQMWSVTCLVAVDEYTGLCTWRSASGREEHDFETTTKISPAADPLVDSAEIDRNNGFPPDLSSGDEDESDQYWLTPSHGSQPSSNA
ncbi:hypothetical protein FS749_007736 [Ceratobasidium sp. UAMH 11750]|nr:hypothetical protein FS749_007736 [Ceratobasidium sp. UAMH 11750]